MLEITRAKINFNEGILELEGKEDFVRSYLDEFKGLLTLPSMVTPKKIKQPMPSNTELKPTKSKVKKTSKRTMTKITPERFDIHGNEKIPSLKQFMEQKKPSKKNGDIILVIGYYITHILGNEKFSEGQVEYAYKMLELSRPNHLHQIMINEKNKTDNIELDPDQSDCWKLTRSGDIFVSEKLPQKQ